ncbi:MAG: hypothetical protein BWX90_00544 [bacterium ADurb.Bin132]|nr:MAG: hypothetical protein BWX90_00544 [bacterium ADurb.Bin132]
MLFFFEWKIIEDTKTFYNIQMAKDIENPVLGKICYGLKIDLKTFFAKFAKKFPSFCNFRYHQAFDLVDGTQDKIELHFIKAFCDIVLIYPVVANFCPIEYFNWPAIPHAGFLALFVNIKITCRIKSIKVPVLGETNNFKAMFNGKTDILFKRPLRIR